jgi:hypothetical protein
MVDSMNNMLGSWNTMLTMRNAMQSPIIALINEQNMSIINAYMTALLAPPYGQRVGLVAEEPTPEEDDFKFVQPFCKLCNDSLTDVMEFLSK